MRRPALLLGLALAAAPVACNKSATKARAGRHRAGRPGRRGTGLRPGPAPRQSERHLGKSRRRAIEMTVEMDEAGQDVIPTLLAALKTPAAARSAAPSGTAHQHPRDGRAGPPGTQGQGKKALAEHGLKTLEHGLKDKKPEVKEHTVNAIGMIGPDAKGSAEAVAKLCSDGSGEVRAAAYRTLQRIKPFPPGPVLRLLVHPDLNIATEAAAALEWLKPTGSESVEPLLAALKREPRPNRSRATSRSSRVRPPPLWPTSAKERSRPSRPWSRC